MESLISNLGNWYIILLIAWWIISAYLLNKINDYFNNRNLQKEKKFLQIKVPYFESKWNKLEDKTGYISILLWMGLIFITGPLSKFNDFFAFLVNLNFFLAIIALIIWLPITILDNKEKNNYIKRYREEHLSDDK